jgi:glutamate-1-semialdehyde 2,1-aminomutase
MKGQELWEKSKRITAGSQLMSKRAELLAPGIWPSFYEKAKGINVWDLDGKKYRDFLFIVGTNPLGYQCKDVDEAVIKAIKKGTMCSLNCPEEVELAEKMLQLHKWAGGVRFARGGNEAMQIAVRIARSFTGRDTLAFSGYHGHGDFYLAANLLDSNNLNEHLLPGLEPSGVPKGLKGTAIPFNYNDVETLEKIAKENQLAAIILEPMRHHHPNEGFLKRVREIADQNGAVLIVDEITTGFRKTVGGVHTLLGLQPDIAVYSKALGNGYPISCVVGKQEIMDVCQAKTFISSTAWSERIGFVAALAVIEKMERENVPAHLCTVGSVVAVWWKAYAEQNSVKIKVYDDFEPIPTFEFDYGESNLALNTLFTQFMLKRGVLSNPKGFYASFAHKEDDMNKYRNDVWKVFAKLGKVIRRGKILESLDGPVAQSGFKRLTE